VKIPEMTKKNTLLAILILSNLVLLSSTTVLATLVMDLHEQKDDVRAITIYNNDNNQSAVTLEDPSEALNYMREKYKGHDKLEEDYRTCMVRYWDLYNSTHDYNPKVHPLDKIGARDLSDY
jgi:hypothetical protein